MPCAFSKKQDTYHTRNITKIAHTPAGGAHFWGGFRQNFVSGAAHREPSVSDVNPLYNNLEIFYTCRAGPAPETAGKAPARLARILLILVRCYPLSDQGETIVQFPRLVCPVHRLPLTPTHHPDTSLVCPYGCRFPVRDGIARFVPAHNYAARFGRQWRRFRTTQLDSHTGTTISRDRLTRMLGGSLDWLAGKTVLEAGCGAGRFTEILLAAGAMVTAVDLSAAVEANRDNHPDHPNLRLLQSDIGRLPFEEAAFDVVVCLGVVQHTPSPEKTLAALAGHVRPGGVLAFDHYTLGYGMTPSRRALRRLVLALPESWSLPCCEVLHAGLWPLHTLAWRWRGRPVFAGLRRRLLRYSPLVDYHDSYLHIGPRLLSEWALLDTHDLLSDHYKHLRSAESLRATLQTLGLADIRIAVGGNGLEVMADKPRPRP